MRRCFAVVLAVLLGCGQGRHVPAPAPAPAPARPRLVVLVVIDQLPVWAFERDRPLFTGGLARLTREAAYAVGELPYANTFTAPGHASIATGAPPRVHGVIGNQWFRRADHRERPAEYDADAPVLPLVPGAALDATASGHALRVEGLADELRRATGGVGRSIAIALKARAACMIVGRHPDLAVWFEAAAGGMTTSRAYADAVPPWLVELARTRPVSRFVGQTWRPLDPALLARATRIADDGPGEADIHGMGAAFPHPIRDLEAIVHTPFGDAAVLDTATAAIAAFGLGADDVPDLLAISLNAHDYAGHSWGPDSWEVLDLTLRLDAALGELFAALDRQVGADGWAVVLTSDHGATPLVERSPHAGARRIPTAEIAALVEAELARSLGLGPWVAKVTASQLYLSDRWHALPVQDRIRTLDELARAQVRMPGIDSVHIVQALRGDCAALPGMQRAVCNALAPDASGDLYLVPSRGSLITDYTTGTHHDAPNDDNRKVPILVRAPGVAPQQGAGSLLQVAPTVAALLGIPAPPAATAAPLFGLRARAPARP